MMVMSPRVRRLALTVHVTVSVGWLGAVSAFLALAIVGLVRHDFLIIRAMYVAMEILGWYVIVPLSFATILTGGVSSMGTTWGLFRHYWIVAKLFITIPATMILLVHMQPIGRAAAVVSGTSNGGGELGGLGIQLVAYAVFALFALIAATALSVYKPPGMTRYGWDRQQEQRTPS